MSFESPDYPLSDLLKMVHEGKIQLPDFQRKWKWDNDRIRGLLSSISLGHPVGVVMLLDVGDEAVFATENLSGSLASKDVKPERLLLDGQQRLTSLYQSLFSSNAVDTEDSRKKKMKVHYFINIDDSLDASSNREDAIVAVPEDRIIREDFGRTIVADYSTMQHECASGMFPLSRVFDSGHVIEWLIEYLKYGDNQDEQREKFSAFQKQILQNFTGYKVPTIVLTKDTSRDAVCTVFEKVNTGGVPLNVFELLTATFAMSGFKLKDDWEERRKVWKEKRVLSNVDSVDFLQSVSLLATLEKRKNWLGSEGDRPGVSCKKHDVLRLTLEDYKKWADPLTTAMVDCANFLNQQHVFVARDLPYRTQLVPLSVIKVLLGKNFNDHGVSEKVKQWYWCGVLGELYGGANETRFARDVEQVPSWASGTGTTPGTVETAIFGDKRLLTLKSRNSAAYKGIYALLMAGGCRDWLENKKLDWAAFLEYKVDIHHIFPKRWCLKNDIDGHKRESIVNKTALSRRTNQKIGGKSPKIYVPKIIEEAELTDIGFDTILTEHFIDGEALRKANFDEFFDLRFQSICGLISRAMGKEVIKNASEFDPSSFSEMDEDDEEDGSVEDTEE
jgi:hypothetical protein